MPQSAVRQSYWHECSPMDRKRLFVSAPRRAQGRSYLIHTRLYWRERVRLRQDSLLDHIPAAIPETAGHHAKTPLLGRNAPLVSRLLPVSTTQSHLSATTLLNL